MAGHSHPLGCVPHGCCNIGFSAQIRYHGDRSDSRGHDLGPEGDQSHSWDPLGTVSDLEAMNQQLMGNALAATNRAVSEDCPSFEGLLGKWVWERQTLRGDEDHLSFGRPLFRGTVWSSEHRPPGRP